MGWTTSWRKKNLSTHSFRSFFYSYFNMWTFWTDDWLLLVKKKLLEQVKRSLYTFRKLVACHFFTTLQVEEMRKTASIAYFRPSVCMLHVFLHIRVKNILALVCWWLAICLFLSFLFAVGNRGRSIIL